MNLLVPWSTGLAWSTMVFLYPIDLMNVIECLECVSSFSTTRPRPLFPLRTPKDSESGEVFVRSASRVGYLDLGVNAKRLNQPPGTFVGLVGRVTGWLRVAACLVCSSF